MSFLNQVLQHEELVQELKSEFDAEKFESTFGQMSAIWQIFLLHIIRPSEYPIFDQHVYLGYRFIQKQDEKSLPFTRTAKMNVSIKNIYPSF